MSMQKNLKELEKFAKLGGAGNNVLIKFIMAQATAALMPSSHLDRCMLYSYLVMFTFMAYASWAMFTTVTRSVCGWYAEVVYCFLAVSVPTFAITLPVYRFNSQHGHLARLGHKHGHAR
jgi:hypothetical protein